MSCLNCPRRCPVDRAAGKRGFCGTSEIFKVGRIALHPWEEPILCGKNGSGAVFFSGCNLRCVYCQNRDISREGIGREISDTELIEKMLDLQDQGAANINLVTPTQYAHRLVPILEKLRTSLKIPVVYNCGGYESLTALRALAGLIDIYLPDCKYFSPVLSKKYSFAPDYFQICMDAIEEMLRQTGKPQLNKDGTMASGVIVRHLILPGARKDSIRLLHELSDRFGNDSFLLSLMRQYTPDFAMGTPYPELHRRLTTFEYTSVLHEAEALGFDGFTQARSSASSCFTPKFGE